MKISKKDLLQKLELLDQKIMGLWLNDNLELHDDERWELFVVLLESRVELLQACKDAQVELTRNHCFPNWLETLTNNRKEIRLRELKKLTEKNGQSAKYKAYENTADLVDGEG